MRNPLQEINSLTAVTILESEVFEEILNDEDEIHQAQLLLTIIDRAKEVGVKTKFETLYKAYKKEHSKREKAKTKLPEMQSYSPVTDFDGNYEQMYCGGWICNDNGVRTTNQLGMEVIACYHPILPIQRLINIDTNKEKIKIAYKKKNRWNEIIFEKGVIASASRIVQLSEYGISVTSENARNLVRFLSDIENMNINKIDVQVSTGKLGWKKEEFVPFGSKIVFDGETKFKDAFESIKEFGDEESWLNLVKDIRKSERFEPKISLISSLASVLIEPLNALPFIVNLWGDTGKGKTVVMMLATSCWAYPGENSYMTDPKSTATALELRLDFLNNLPMLIDDMAQLKEKYGGDFSELVYMLCSGKGKDRANTSLGLNKSSTWKNVILTNGEHSLVTETMQGGAVNRIIDVEMEEGYIFSNGNEVVETIKKNYGFAGRRFLEAIDQIGVDRIKEWQQKAYKKIVERAKELGVEKEEKQVLPMSILLVADLIATDYIFEDKQYLDFNRCVDLLKNKGEVSENERAYDFIMSEVGINMNKFKPDDNGKYRNEIWGCIEKGYVAIMSNVFSRMCEKGNFSSKSFISWAKKRDLIDSVKGRNTKQKRLEGSLSWCVFIKMPHLGEANEESENASHNGFTELTEEQQEELPFM